MYIEYTSLYSVDFKLLYCLNTTIKSGLIHKSAALWCLTLLMSFSDILKRLILQVTVAWPNNNSHNNHHRHCHSSTLFHDDDDDDDDDDGRINFNVAYSPKTSRTRNS